MDRKDCAVFVDLLTKLAKSTYYVTDSIKTALQRRLNCSNAITISSLYCRNELRLSKDVTSHLLKDVLDSRDEACWNFGNEEMLLKTLFGCVRLREDTSSSSLGAALETMEKTDADSTKKRKVVLDHALEFISKEHARNINDCIAENLGIKGDATGGRKQAAKLKCAESDGESSGVCSCCCSDDE